ncbi:3 beta-hydroxysteroid dehydrogenase/Delta 5--4-isomerase [Frankliniella fusca]|uniref:3 beta-hydroxysteroid dehydrogenase/Delta 5--4-isomerase n=1 Tax=Frankliniella fusca TaxID=407009 RepID=A0AAE1GV42_9NEOP|nr:3 beta-hydroxysteroid dehydrogenase/Delta 5--4-isomerase [Frankliniella fusca]
MTDKMESFFASYNNAEIAKAPTYRANAEVPRYKFMQLQKIEPAVTSVGPTFKLVVSVDCMVDIFFYLNKTDSQRITAENCIGLNDLIAAGQKPFVFMVQTRNMLRTTILPYSDEYFQFYQEKKQVLKRFIPTPLQNDMDFGSLAQIGIIFE